MRLLRHCAYRRVHIRIWQKNIPPKNTGTVQRSKTPSRREQASAIADEVVEICHVFNTRVGEKIGPIRT